MALELTSKDFRKLLAFGSGVGIEIGAADLEVAAARVRPTGIQVLGRLTIENYAQRPAAEWGAEYARFLKSAGAERISATVLLPRREVIVRQVALPGVAAQGYRRRDPLPVGFAASLRRRRSRLGLVAAGVWQRAGGNRAARRWWTATSSLFAEAGIAVSSFTFSAAAVHAAIRLNGNRAAAARDSWR